MKITQKDADKLVLEDTPWMMGKILIVLIVAFGLAAIASYAISLWPFPIIFGLTFALLCAMFFFAVRRTQVTFDKSQKEVIKTVRSMIGTKSTNFPLKHVKRITVDVSKGKQGKKESYRLEIEFTDASKRATLPMTLVMRTDFDAIGTRDEINDWLCANEDNEEHN